MDVAIVWAEFLLCAVVIGVAGPVLARSGEIIADKTGLSQGWIGLILLATATSLPELFTGMSAVTIAAAPNVAVGDVLGSCVFNLAILIVLDAMHESPSIYHRAGRAHILTAAFGVVLIGLAGVAILLGSVGMSPAIAHVGLYSPIIVLLYLVSMRALFVYEHRRLEIHPGEVVDRYPETSLRQAVKRYVTAASIIIAAGTWLPFVALDLAEVTGWRTTFVGSLMVAGVTSLPEAVVTISAARLGALDMAMSNLLGSNLFNITVLAVDDVVMIEGPLLSAVAPTHTATAFSATIMTGVVIIALLYRPETRLYRTIGWASLSLLLIYVLNSYVLYVFGH